MIGLDPPKLNFRTSKMTKEKSMKNLLDISREIEKHIGQFAILKEKDGRNNFVFLIRITSKIGGVYRNFNNAGEYNGDIFKSLSPILILTNVQQIVFLDEV